MKDQKLAEKIKNVISLSNKLPEDIEFYKLVDVEIQKAWDEVRTELVTALGDLLNYLGKTKEKFEVDFCAADVIDEYQDVLDNLYEKIVSHKFIPDICLF